MLIGFIGKIGSGKTMSADFLVHDYKFSKQNFKDALDLELLELYPKVLLHLMAEGEKWTPEEVLQFKPTFPAIRELKQKHGTEVRRGHDVDYWQKKWIERYTKTFNDNVCADDVRFFNEVEAIKRFGGIIVRIERTDIKDTGDHESETALDEYEADYTISADKGDWITIHMALEDIIEKHDTGTREEDSNNSGAYAEYAEGVHRETGE